MEKFCACKSERRANAGIGELIRTERAGFRDKWVAYLHSRLRTRHCDTVREASSTNAWNLNLNNGNLNNNTKATNSNRVRPVSALFAGIKKNL